MEDIEVVEAFRGEVETPKVGTGFALIRKYTIYSGSSRVGIGLEDARGGSDSIGNY